MDRIKCIIKHMTPRRIVSSIPGKGSNLTTVLKNGEREERNNHAG